MEMCFSNFILVSGVIILAQRAIIIKYPQRFCDSYIIHVEIYKNNFFFNQFSTLTIVTAVTLKKKVDVQVHRYNIRKLVIPKRDYKY